jgi:hypothetical protein
MIGVCRSCSSFIWVIITPWEFYFVIEWVRTKASLVASVFLCVYESLCVFCYCCITSHFWRHVDSATAAASAGGAFDRCLFSRADLEVAARMAFFDHVEFYLMSHVEVNVRIREAVKTFMAERKAQGLIVNKTTKKHFKELARLIFGNVQGVPLFAKIVGEERVSLRPFLKETLVVPPVMHCQV